MATILVVDDSAGVRGLLRTLLEGAGHVVLEAADGAGGLRRLYTERPDLLVLDVQLPDLDGWTLLQRIRAISDVPIVVCSARTAPATRVRALVDGADDFVGKPFDNRELVARVAALLRRAAARPRPPAPDVLDDGWAKVDVTRYEALVGGARLDVTPLEFRLLGAFVRHPGVALTHDQLLALAWGDGLGSREQVKVAVAGLRRKLARRDPQAAAAIETVRGIGYRWRGHRRPLQHAR